MTQREHGLFEAFVNAHAHRITSKDRELMGEITRLSRAILPGSQVRWAGSQRKGTAILESDLDLCLESREPVTEAMRRKLRTQLEEGMGRAARILSHVIRLPASDERPKVDLAFANAAFGSRPLPDPGPFHDQRSRQAAARAIKLWTRTEGLPRVPGWVVEAMVLHLDTPPRSMHQLELFLRIVGWIEEKATPSAIEGVLRPDAFPRWNPQWSSSLPGGLEALKNHARALRRRGDPPSGWKSADDVERWLYG